MNFISRLFYSHFTRFVASTSRKCYSPPECIKKRWDALYSMIFPEGSNPDNSPLYVICCNDTCSFTWTGAEHINQARNNILLIKI